ncbi:DUF2461 domain-containing protein [Flavobacterium cellulosilyticum]|uniref:DUF2461 domain-containing protein n=1 Tax=Flavobacterium cellulosilyticum TaxID=2541731 RepID=A0A4R5CFC3_9FLAO|nr:DUF2461 domain-containing protein [Flavobacterium cellulosilyticum]TDD95922.1 DUF2461 domain-containing protein [Flavobacterium cellulosilyticum]
MENTKILPNTITFLKNLETNNNREWFAENKQTYIEAQANIITFVDELILLMNTHDAIENTSGKKSLYRIYNDVRFSKDKSPYKPRFAFSLQRATKLKRGGYYVNIQPGNTFLACGFFSPNPEDLKRIRKDIEVIPGAWRKILNAKPIIANFVELAGNKVPTFPKGFPKDHEAIDLIRHKQFILRHNFTDQDVIDPEFVNKTNEIFKTVRPFFDHLTLVLTTDLNGEINV